MVNWRLPQKVNGTSKKTLINQCVNTHPKGAYPVYLSERGRLAFSAPRRDKDLNCKYAIIVNNQFFNWMRKKSRMQLNDIPPAYFSDRVLAVMSDGRWYSSRWLKDFMRPSTKGVMTGTLAQLLRYGMVQRAKNPAFNGRPFYKAKNCKYLYRITGKDTPAVREICGSEERYRAWLLMRNLPKAWIEIIR